VIRASAGGQGGGEKGGVSGSKTGEVGVVERGGGCGGLEGLPSSPSPQRISEARGELMVGEVLD